MRDSIKSCFEITEQLRQITQLPKDQLQDEQYHEITKCLADREELLQDIVPPFTDEEKQVGKQIVQLNQVIDKRLVEMKKDIAIKIKNLKKKEQSSQSYLGYSQAAPSSYFLDKKN
ncbi:hypothetical protein [Bacillus massiliigorillae]|uniref:hypothetical protein n=1 Tax=Bacillus massiliigorillae TaxID=1243664 RepID=UPI0003A2F53A|nr:hypothetical protein [Bacillus massiliigorillae]